MTSDWDKENYLVLDWSIESLEDRCEYLEESGILQDLSRTERRKSKFAKAQLNMVTTYLLRSKDIKSGRKVDESYYVDESSYLRSLKTLTYMEDIDRIPDDDDDEEDHDVSDSSTDKGSGKDDKEKDDELDSDDELGLGLDLDLETEIGYEEYDDADSKNDDLDRYVNSIDNEQDTCHERLLHIENLFDPKNIDHTVLRKVVTTYRDIEDIEFDSDVVKSNVVKIMESVLMCVDNDDDKKVIELLMKDMTEREISSVMNVSRQSVNKRIRKIFRKTIKLLKN